MKKNLKSNLELSLGQGNILKNSMTLFYSIYLLFSKVSVEELESQKESNTESGYAWEIQDSSMSRVEGKI